jgi:hypothetical protein
MANKKLKVIILILIVLFSESTIFGFIASNGNVNGLFSEIRLVPTYKTVSNASSKIEPYIMTIPSSYNDEHMLPATIKRPDFSLTFNKTIRIFDDSLIERQQTTYDAIVTYKNPFNFSIYFRGVFLGTSSGTINNIENYDSNISSHDDPYEWQTSLSPNDTIQACFGNVKSESSDFVPSGYPDYPTTPVQSNLTESEIGNFTLTFVFSNQYWQNVLAKYPGSIKTTTINETESQEVQNGYTLDATGLLFDVVFLWIPTLVILVSGLMIYRIRNKLRKSTTLN